MNPRRPGIQAWRPGRPRRLGSKMTKTLMPPGVRIMSPTHSRRCAATGAPNAPERPCRDDAEHATTRVSKRDRDAALLRLQHVPRWRLLVSVSEKTGRVGMWQREGDEQKIIGQLFFLLLTGISVLFLTLRRTEKKKKCAYEKTFEYHKSEDPPNEFV